MRRTYSDLLDPNQSRLVARLGMCASDSRIPPLVNSAQQQLLNEGKWYGTYAKFAFCTNDHCVTLPPQIATVETIAVCHMPIPVRNQWFEFLEYGLGTRDGCSCWPEALARGHYPTFKDIHGKDKKIRWIVDVLADVGQTALFLGYDENGNWIRTKVMGVWQDGVVLTAAQAPGTTSTQIFSRITDIQLSSTMSGQSWLYSFSTTDSSLRMLGHYQAFETRPSYARYLFPTLQQNNSCCSTATIDGEPDCRPTLVEAICKLEFIPVKNPTDYLLISNIPALVEMVVALYRSENEMDSLKSNGIRMAGLGVAKTILDKELEHYLGNGAQFGINIRGSCMPDGGAPVANLV